MDSNALRGYIFQEIQYVLWLVEGVFCGMRGGWFVRSVECINFGIGCRHYEA